MKELEKDLNALKNDLSKLRSHISVAARNAVDDAVEKGRVSYTSAKDSILKNSRKTYSTVERTLSEKPVATVLGALAAGLVLGYLGHRRNSHRE